MKNVLGSLLEGQARQQIGPTSREPLEFSMGERLDQGDKKR